MPTRTMWIDPELFLEHHGVKVLHTYKDDDVNQGQRCYWLTVNPECGVTAGVCEDQPCRHVFDVRELSTWREPEHSAYCTDKNNTPQNHAAWERYWNQEARAIKAAVIAAIDRGELSTRGWQAGGPTQRS
jgi:hypothetical protein